ncbi:hypothetical protein ACFW6E_08835 [Streptomyces olivaceoviridis]|uniref:hypothetical protein n=1 Tax=Streptomyces olivaceoviridis TaxID=1921 RepID=UPI0036B55C64
MNQTDPETARALLYRHGLPEDVIDGVLCLHAQELAAVQRLRMDELDLTGQKARAVGCIIDLIDPTKGAVASAVVSPPTSRAELRDRVRRVLCERDGKGYLWGTDMLEPDEYGDVADSVLAVLGEQTDQAADVEHWQRMYNAEHARHVAVVGALVTDRVAVRTETLREAETALREQASRLTGEFNDSDILHEDGPAATVATWKRAADLLRRLAVEAHGTETQMGSRPGTCGHRGPEGHQCGRESGHHGYHRHVHDGDGWVSWVGELSSDAPAPVAEQPAATHSCSNCEGVDPTSCLMNPNRQQPAAADDEETLCICGHYRIQHVKVSGRLLCDECDGDSTRVCNVFTADA